MNRTLLAIVSALALAAPFGAQAADMPLKAPAPPPPPPSLTGCYVDGGAGYGLWVQDHTTNTLFAGVPGTTITQRDGGYGWLGRVGVGCDYQAGHFLFGAFTDYDFASISGTNNVPNPLWTGAPGAWSSALGGGMGAYGNEKETGAWAIGARVGYLVTPSLLAYFDAGYTQARFGSVHLFTDQTPPVDTVSWLNAKTYNGWFVGGGDEYQLSFFPGLFWRSEYRFSQYQAADLPCWTVGGALCTLNGAPGWAEHSQKEVQTATSSLVWRFNWGGPVAARY